MTHHETVERPEAPEGLDVEVVEAPKRLSTGYRETAVEPGRFRATRRWWTPAVLFMTLFALFWDGFLVLWYSIAFGFTGMGALSGIGICFVLFPLGHVAVGVAITWWVIATWFNRTVVDVRDGRVTSSVGPIPWPFGRTHAVVLDAVDRFRVEAKGARRGYGVVAEMKDGEALRVVAHLRNEGQAGWVAWCLGEQLP